MHFEEIKFVYKIHYTTLMSHCRRQFVIWNFPSVHAEYC